MKMKLNSRMMVIIPVILFIVALGYFWNNSAKEGFRKSQGPQWDSFAFESGKSRPSGTEKEIGYGLTDKVDGDIVFKGTTKKVPNNTHKFTFNDDNTITDTSTKSGKKYAVV